MLVTTFATVLAATIFNISPLFAQERQEVILAQHQISLETRQADRAGNEVFKDNILLNIKYMDGYVAGTPVNWDEIRKPFKYEMVLHPNETFAYHSDILPEYSDKGVKTTNAHFNMADGFKSVYGLPGNGVCHLASLMNWTAKDAHLVSHAPTNHDFAAIPEISKEHGVAIYNSPGSPQVGARQNLYITNNREKPVTFRFDYDGTNLTLTVLEYN